MHHEELVKDRTQSPAHLRVQDNIDPERKNSRGMSVTKVFIDESKLTWFRLYIVYPACPLRCSRRSLITMQALSPDRC